jgi:small subunit ribosomal protein S17
MAEEQTTEQKAVGHKNQKVGKVVSAKMAKTIVVEVTRRVPHPVYKRVISKRKKFYAHDEESAAKIGDTVRIIECRPISKLKRWRLGDIVRKAVQVAVEPANVDLDTPVAPLGTKPASKPPAGRKS